MSNINFFKSLPLIAAIPTAMILGVSSLFFGTKLIPIFFQVTDLIQKGEPIDSKGAAVIGMLVLMGCFTYALALGFQLSQKRVIELVYDKT